MTTRPRATSPAAVTTNERYAVNLCNLLANKDDLGLQIALSPAISNDPQTVECEPNRIDGGTAIVLTGNNDQIKAIIQVVRLKYPKYSLRIYHTTKPHTKWGWKHI